MRDLLRWLLGIANAEDGDENSKDTARQRLRLVLIQDRLDLAPEKMEAMKREIWEVVSKYMVVEDEFMEFEGRQSWNFGREIIVAGTFTADGRNGENETTDFSGTLQSSAFAKEEYSMRLTC